MRAELFAVIGVVILMIGIPVVLLIQKRGSNSAAQTPAFTASTTASSELFATATVPQQVSIPSGFKKYYNRLYRFWVYHPQDMTVKQYDDGGGAATVVFQNTAQAQGFQIFITPYSGTIITDQRFRKDIPSGVHEKVESTVINGVEAVTFIGENSFLGRTREVWFIRNGYLYEVTAPESQTDLIVSVMRTWEFL